MLSDSLLITAFSLSAYGCLMFLQASPLGSSLAALRSAVTYCKLLRAATKFSKAECLDSLSFSGQFWKETAKQLAMKIKDRFCKNNYHYC